VEVPAKDSGERMIDGAWTTISQTLTCVVIIFVLCI